MSGTSPQPSCSNNLHGTLPSAATCNGSVVHGNTSQTAGQVRQLAYRPSLPEGPLWRAAAAVRAPCCSQTPSCTGGRRGSVGIVSHRTRRGGCSSGEHVRTARQQQPAHLCLETRRRQPQRTVPQSQSRPARRLPGCPGPRNGKQRARGSSAPSHRAKVGQHAGSQAADDNRVRPQVCCLGADGLCDARRRAVHLEAQQQLLVLDAWDWRQGGAGRCNKVHCMPCTRRCTFRRRRSSWGASHILACLRSTLPQPSRAARSPQRAPLNCSSGT